MTDRYDINLDPIECRFTVLDKYELCRYQSDKINLKNVNVSEVLTECFNNAINGDTKSLSIDDSNDSIKIKINYQDYIAFFVELNKIPNKEIIRLEELIESLKKRLEFVEGLLTINEQ